ncbi:MAG: phosphate signaling complex protein PhoU [Dehalococcoidia bacterium]
MPRALFEQHLHDLCADVLELGGRVEQAIRRAMQSLERRDLELARDVVEEDQTINRCRFSIEERAVDLIATQQPVASDLRTLITVLFVATELERTGDYAEGVARISLLLGEQSLPRPLDRLQRMADFGIEMMHDALTAFTTRDVNLARAVCDADDALDTLYDANYAEVISRLAGDPHAARRYTYQLWTAHNLERIGDRATNIAERVVYLATGAFVEINVSRY